MNAVMTQRAGRYAVAALAGCFAVGALIENLASPTVTIGGHRYDRGADAAIAAALCAAVVLVALRRRIGAAGPIAAVAAFGLVTLPAPSWVLNSDFVFLLVMLVCGISGYLATSRSGPAGLAVIWAVAGAAEWRNPEHSVAHVISVGAFMTIAWCAGLLTRRPVKQARSAQERALQLEQQQADAARQAVMEERQRIARELHDIIAHSVSVMTMQAGAVRRLLAPGQVRERESLLSIEQTGRDAMSEMRRLVGLLKVGEAAPAYSPQPGMQSLDALVTTVREAGLPIEVTVEGEPLDLPPGVDLTAFRVVQEALTNALKHAGPARAWVRVSWTLDEVHMEIGNDGDGQQGGGPGGHGLAGMRERLSLYGGRLQSGPVDGGGYVVQAALPVRTAT